MSKILFKWNELKATFWFVPIILIICSVLLFVSLVYIDGLIKVPSEGLGRFFFVSSSDSARSILSTISAAMIGVAGTVFSVTLVALTLASSQFGPRLIKNFMYVRLNQIVLGAYISTYLYCLLVLTAVKDEGGYTFIPSMSILVAILATIANIVLLIVFIHQIATSIQADEIISDISESISERVKKLFPEKMGEGAEQEEYVDAFIEIGSYKKSSAIKSLKSGYLQHIDSANLMELVRKYDALLELYYKPGGYLVEGIELARIYYEEDWGEDKSQEILNQFVIGETKTVQQDVEFSIHQMVEIAARALSPGVNDPYTAIACIDNLTATMAYLAQAKFPSKYRLDKEGKLRIITEALTFDGVLDAAFNQIRQFSGGSTAVIIRLMEALTTIYGFIEKESHKEAVVKHAEMVLTVGEQTIKEKNDIQDLIERSEKILKTQE